jgi:hypothetical protein
VPGAIGGSVQSIHKTVETPLAAGVLMYARPIEKTRISNILYSFRKITSDNNTIEGNIIKGFGYGIFSLGMGASLDNFLYIEPMYNKNNKFVGNLIENIYKGGVFLGFEENAVVSKNRIHSV